MAYTNTWQIISPVISDDWTDMDNALTDLKTDIVERVWEDGLHLQTVASGPVLSASQAAIFTKGAKGSDLFVSDGAATPVRLVSGGVVAPAVAITPTALNVVPVYGGIIDSSGIMKAAICSQTQVTVTTQVGFDYVHGIGYYIPAEYGASTVFWDDGSAFICKRWQGADSEFTVSYVEISGDTPLIYIERDTVAAPRTFSVCTMVKV